MDSTEWLEGAVSVVDDAVNQLVTGFLDNPYMHRSEIGVHAELFRLLSHSSLLSQQTRLRTRVPMFGRPVRLASQPIQLEWPARTKAGWVLYDIGIINPVTLRSVTPTMFENGNVRPDIAIEVGLRASSDAHFWDDFKKLQMSDVPRLYLVDLGRRGGSRFELEQKLADVGDRFKTAYGRDFGATGQRIKLTADTSVQWRFRRSPRRTTA